VSDTIFFPSFTPLVAIDCCDSLPLTCAAPVQIFAVIFLAPNSVQASRPTLISAT
jgi:hypothetical protein